MLSTFLLSYTSVTGDEHMVIFKMCQNAHSRQFARIAMSMETTTCGYKLAEC